jgi:uncharacterized RDD family membrane protein YckC
MDAPQETPELPSNPTTESVDILDDVHYTLYQASGGKRFVNYLIDWIGFSLIWRFFLARLVGEFIVLINFPYENRTALYAFSYLSAITFFGLIVGGVEAATGGKTLGKLVTNTRAIKDDGSRLTPTKAFLRYLVRLVPFEQFSALGSPSYPWHDRWTKTLVIDEKLTTLPPQV